MKEISFVLKQKIFSVIYVLICSILLMVMGDPIEMIKFGGSLFSKE